MTFFDLVAHCSDKIVDLVFIICLFKSFTKFCDTKFTVSQRKIVEAITEFRSKRIG